MTTHPINGGSGIAVAVVSNWEQTHRAACWYTTTGELMVGVQNRSTQAWSTTTIIGLARAALALPVVLDTHCFAAVVICGDGRLKVFANMHDHPIREITTVNPVIVTGSFLGGLSSWVAGDVAGTAGTDLTGADVHNSYPTPIQHPDGSVRLYLRDGVSSSAAGRSNSHIWDMAAGASVFGSRTLIFKGLNVANGKGTGVTGDDSTAGDTYFNWNAYPSNPVVQDVGGGNYIEHWTWLWRRTGVVALHMTDGIIFNGGLTLQSATGGFNPDFVGCDVAGTNVLAGTTVAAYIDDNNLTLTPGSTVSSSQIIDITGNSRGINHTPSYMQYRSATNSWHTITGATVTLPVDPINTTSVQMGFSPIPPDPTYINVGGLTIDDNGYPHWIMSRNPHYHVYWNGSTWTQTQITNQFGAIIGTSPAQSIQSRVNPYWSRGRLWMLGMGGLASDPVALKQIPRLWRLDGVCSLPLGGWVPAGPEGADFGFSTGPWEPTADPVAWLTRRSIEVLTPVDDTPLVYEFGAGKQMIAA